MKKLSMPPIERKWVKCPYCGAKVMLYDNTAQCSGVFRNAPEAAKKNLK